MGLREEMETWDLRDCLSTQGGGTKLLGLENHQPRASTPGPEGQGRRKKEKRVAIDVNCRLTYGWNEEHIYAVCHAPMSHPVTGMRA